MHVLAGEQIWSGEESYVVRAIFSLESNLVAGDPEFRILCWPNSLLIRPLAPLKSSSDSYVLPRCWADMRHAPSRAAAMVR